MNLTRMINNIETKRGYEIFNKSIPGQFEMCGLCEDSSSVTFADAKSLLKTLPNGRISNDPTSLLNFTNCQFLLENQDSVPAVSQRFKISESQAASLINYIKKLLRSYRILSDKPLLDYQRSNLISNPAKMARDGVLYSLELLKKYTFNNITTKALFQIVMDRKALFKCKDYFMEPYSNKICTDPEITIERYEGTLLWVLAYYRDFQPMPGPELDARELLMVKLGIKEVSIFTKLLTQTRLDTTLKEIQKDFARKYECYRNPCDKKYLAELQFHQSRATNIVHKKYPNLNVKYYQERSLVLQISQRIRSSLVPRFPKY